MVTLYLYFRTGELKSVPPQFQLPGMCVLFLPKHVLFCMPSSVPSGQPRTRHLDSQDLAQTGTGTHFSGYAHLPKFYPKKIAQLIELYTIQ